MKNDQVRHEQDHSFESDVMSDKSSHVLDLSDNKRERELWAPRSRICLLGFCKTWNNKVLISNWSSHSAGAPETHQQFLMRFTFFSFFAASSRWEKVSSDLASESCLSLSFCCSSNSLSSAILSAASRLESRNSQLTCRQYLSEGGWFETSGLPLEQTHEYFRSTDAYF